jgi:ABC-type multidrug transport system ATPase subunit
VAILSKGRILIQSTVADLRRRLKGDRTKVRVKLERTDPALEMAVQESGIALAAHLDGDTLECDLANGRGVPDLVALLSKRGARILSVQEEAMGLEQMFLELTKGEGGR